MCTILGTASSLRVEGIDICGKTGTAENFAKINGVRTTTKRSFYFCGFCTKRQSKNCNSNIG